MDCRKIEDLLKDANIMSVNHIAAQIKLTEMLKAVHDNGYQIMYRRSLVKKKGCQWEVVYSAKLWKWDFQPI